MSRLDTLPKDTGEVWKYIPDLVELYAVSNQGRVFSFIVNRLLSPVVNERGYLQLSLQGKNRVVHRLVLEAFEGPCPEGMLSRHLDSVKTNCRLSNLEWSTAGRNIADNLDTKKVHTQKLSVADVRRIRGEEWDKSKINAFCAAKGIAFQAFYKAQTGRTFRHVPM